MSNETSDHDAPSRERAGPSRRVWVVLGILFFVLILSYFMAAGGQDLGDDTPYIDFDEPTATSDAESRLTTTVEGGTGVGGNTGA